MAFSKKQVEDRKAWLSAYVPGTFLDQRNPRIPYKEFIHKVSIPMPWIPCPDTYVLDPVNRNLYPGSCALEPVRWILCPGSCAWHVGFAQT